MNDGSAPERSLPATVFGGDFRVLSHLSAGGMGTVFVAEQLSTGRKRALKLMQPHLVADRSMRERFSKEAKIAASIESDHVVEVIAAGVDPATSVPWIAMELLTGIDLATACANKGPFSTADVHEIFIQLAHAFGAAHRAGIVHRDLKPENVFLAKARRAGVAFDVKVLDFGIAKITADASGGATQSVGTPLWMAPEQTSLGGVITPAADVWAMGLLAFRLLAGTSYWLSADDPSAPTVAILREMLLDPLEAASARARRKNSSATLPAGFDAWFARCVARPAGDRFADADAAFDALSKVLLGTMPTSGALALPVPHSPDRPSSNTLAAAPLESSMPELEEIEVEPDVESVRTRPSTRPSKAPPARKRPSSLPGPSGDYQRIASCIASLEEDPSRVEICRTLLALAHRNGAKDLCWRAACLLAHFEAANEQEQRLSAPPSRPPILTLQRPLDAATWQLLAPALDPRLASVFRAVAPALARAATGAQKTGAPRVDPSARVDPRTSSWPLPRLFAAIVTALGIDEPALHLQPDVVAPIVAVHGEPVNVVIGGPLVVANAEATFVITRYLAGLRRELYVPLFIGTTADLRRVFAAIAALCGLEPPGMDDAARNVQQSLGATLRPEERNEVWQATRALLATQATVDMRQVLRTADLAAMRAATLLTGDLEASCRALARSRRGELSLEELERELLSFWIGRTHGQLRAELGLALTA